MGIVYKSVSLSWQQTLRAVTLIFGRVCHRVSGSVGSHALKGGDSACFTICFLLGCCSLFLDATSSGLGTHWTLLYHKRDEELAFHFPGGGALVPWWLHYLHFQV